jgi:hypothetical protein
MRGCSTRVIICGVSPREMASRLRISRFATIKYSRTEGHQVSVCQGFTSVSTTADGEPKCDISSLLEMLGKLPDPRSARGRIYRLSFILAVSLVAVLAGASNFRQIRDQVADMPQSLLRKLGGKWCYFRRLFDWPSERTIRRVLEAIDAAALDQITGTWLQANARRGAQSALELAIDGKVMRGSWTDTNEQFTLFSAMIHSAGVTIGQVQVPADTHEITQAQDAAGHGVSTGRDTCGRHRGCRAHTAGHRKVPQRRARFRLRPDREGESTTVIGIGVSTVPAATA